MNYYKRHIGDYARDTGHLTALEHGIYGLLLDWYYVNERPIPDEKANRIAKANRTETESVLSDFFKLGDQGWVHSRAEREIAEYKARAETNRVTGRLGGRPKKNPTGYESVSETKPKETLATNHKPLTIKEQKQTIAQAAPTPDGFDRFWAAYPNKQGKQAARKTWDKKRLEPRADEFIAHVQMMMRECPKWRDGFIPEGSTYVNQGRWDDRPRAAPQQSNVPTSKAGQAIVNIEGYINGLDNRGSRQGHPEADLLVLGSPARK